MEVKDLLIIYIDKNLQHYHPIIISISINYKKQVMIMDIKLSMQCLICQVLSYKHENVYKM